MNELCARSILDILDRMADGTNMPVAHDRLVMLVKAIIASARKSSTFRLAKLRCNLRRVGVLREVGYE
jgi:hypothetical protein